MSSLREMQCEFLNYLLEKPSSIVNNIVTTGNITNQQRLDLYADGYKLRLKEAISTDYEQLHAYLGDDQFELLMDEYISQYPSPHPSLRYYSGHIPELLSTQLSWKLVPELVEIANIEKAFCTSFDATDCIPVTLDDLASVGPEGWPTLRVQFHDSVQLLTMKYNSFQIWKALSEDKNPPPLIEESTNWLIWRQKLVTRYRAISDAETALIQTMIDGGDFSHLCENLLDFYDEHQIPQQVITLLQRWISDLMISQLNIN